MSFLVFEIQKKIQNNKKRSEFFQYDSNRYQKIVGNYQIVGISDVSSRTIVIGLSCGSDLWLCYKWVALYIFLVIPFFFRPTVPSLPPKHFFNILRIDMDSEAIVL